MKNKQVKYCLLVPHFNHERQFLTFLPKLIETGLDCLIIDDGSNEESLAQVRQAVQEHSSVHLFEHSVNRGKGAAVKTGFYHARHLGFSHAIQIDADGQHDIEDISKLIAASKTKPLAMICGKPVFDESAPKARLYGRKVTDFWVALETLSTKIKDGLCGFRIYPISQMETLLDTYYVGSRMNFDTDILVKSVWLDIELVFINTKVIYPEQSVSHFNYLRDNLLLIKLHTRLMFGMIAHLPKLLWRMTGRKK